MDKKHVLSFSGGKDSTALLFKMIEKKFPIDQIVFIDTTKEFPEMYDHIIKVKKAIYPLVIETVEMDFDYWFFEHIKTRGKNKGQKGYGFPLATVRWCTRRKINSFIRYVYGGKYQCQRAGGRMKRILKK